MQNSQKILSILVIIAVNLISACSTTNSHTPNAKTIVQPNENYICENNDEISVNYSLGGSEAKITITSPKFDMQNHTVTLLAATSASGSRYVNNNNPDINYEWHIKSNSGILTISKNGKEYDIFCEK